MGVIGFTGTSTGNVYVVGQTYTSAGREYVAQADGTFRTVNSDGTVRSTEGSSQSDTATFFYSRDSGAARGGNVQSGGDSPSAGRPVAASPAGAGPGNAAVASVPNSSSAFAELFAAAGFPSGTQFVARQDGSLDASMVRYEVADGVFLDTTVFWANGKLLPGDPSTSDVQDLQQRYGDDNPIVSTLGAGYVGGTAFGSWLGGQPGVVDAAPGSSGSAWAPGNGIMPSGPLTTNNSAWAPGNGIVK